MSKPDPIKRYLIDIGRKGGKKSAQKGDMAERGKKGAAARWAGHVAKRTTKKKS